MAGGAGVEHAAEGIIAKAAKSFLRDAVGAAGKDAARDGAEKAATRSGEHGLESGLEHTAEDAAGLTVGDGSRRTLDQQLADPHLHPTNADIVERDYDPFGGEGGPDEFRDRFYDETGGDYGNGEWRWPDNAGAVPGSEQIVPPSELGSLDRIGGDGGTYFSPKDTPFGQRALPPDRLNFERRQFDIDPNNPAIQDGSVRVEKSTIAPAFGQSGGGVQYRFLGPDGKAIPTGDLITTYKIFK